MILKKQWAIQGLYVYIYKNVLKIRIKMFKVLFLFVYFFFEVTLNNINLLLYRYNLKCNLSYFYNLYVNRFFDTYLMEKIN